MSLLTAYDKFIQQAIKYGFSLFGTPKTGQITGYRNGDDVFFNKGYPKKPPRFIDNGDGTITDNATGLMWVKNPGAIGGNFGSAETPLPMTWNNAIDECVLMTYAGLAGWRLPNINELHSIVDFGKNTPAIDDLFNCLNEFYWASTTYKYLTAYAWYLEFDYGRTYRAAKTETHYPRPVRLGG